MTKEILFDLIFYKVYNKTLININNFITILYYF